ncbi:hypothetical protein FRB99_003775 [Tulasnella sp. 403]|nr:hypothetical protein FRB99_003775 [Tulasnella sp. 403]
MRASVLLTALFAAAASAAVVAEPRDIKDYPSCALPCFREVDNGRCRPGDLECLCDSKRWLDDTQRCFRRRCDDRDERMAFWAQKKTCDRFDHHGGWDHGDHDHDNDGHGGWDNGHDHDHDGPGHH